MNELLQKYDELANSLKDELDNTLDRVAQISSELSNWTSSNQVPFSDVWARSRAITDLAHTLSKTPAERYLLAPFSKMGAFRDTLENLLSQTTHFNEQLNNVASWGGANSVDINSLFAANGNAIPVRSMIDTVWNTQDSALEAYLSIASATSPRGIGTFADASRKLNKFAIDAGQALASLQSDINAVDSLVKNAAAREQQAAEAANEATRHLGEIEGRRKASEEQSAAMAAALATVEELRSKAAILEQQVNDLRPKLDGFDQSLKQRNKAHADAMKQLSDATSGLTAKSSELDAIVQQAKDILGQATVAGLSKEYANQATAIDEQLGSARKAYYVSVALLVVSVIIALGLLPSFVSNPLKPMPEWQSGTPTAAYIVQILGNLGSRLLVILPAGLLAAFASSRHSALFRLREEYNHKKGLAASIDGFKSQAPQFAEPMTAAVFQELARNPATSIDGKADHSPNGYLTRILEPRVRETILAMLAPRDGVALIDHKTSDRAG